MLEDIDSANPDVIEALFTLSEDRTHTLPTGETMHVHEDCRMLATLQVDGGRQSMLNMVKDFPYVVNIPSLSIEDLAQISEAMFPRLESIRTKLLAIFTSVCHEMTTFDGRSQVRQLNPRYCNSTNWLQVLTPLIIF